MATYYVSTGGSDSAAGTEGAPWRTLTKAWATMVAGDTTYVRGGTYNTSSDRGMSLVRSGATNNRIRVMAYPGETPIFDGGDSTTRFLNWGAYAWNEINGLTIQNFDAEGVYSNSSAAIGNRIIDCDFKYFNHDTSAWRSNTSIVCNIRQGNWVVSGCTFIYCKGNCIALNGSSAVIQYTTFQYGKPEATLFSAGNSNGVTIEYCNFLDLIEPWGGDTHVDYIQWWGDGNHNWIVRNNYFRTHCYKINSGDAGYNNACIQTDGSNDNLQVYNNVVYHAATMGTGRCAYGFNIKLGVNVDVFNNTIYGAQSYGIRLQDVSSGSVYNNIVLNSGNGLVVNSGINNGNNYTSGDAQFVNLTQENLRLQSSSPCINNGNNTPTGITLPSYDKDGNARIVNGTVDQGAYEYGSGSTPTAATGVTYYVATTGNDSNAGTAIGAAWLTPGKAFATAQVGDTVNYRTGTYNIATTLNTVNAGEPDNRIVHQAYPGETPVFNRITDGSKDIITIWHPYTTISGISFTNGVDNTDYSNMIHTVRVQVGGSYALLTDLHITSPGHTIFGIQASGSPTSRLTGITARNVTVSAMGMYAAGANWNTGLKYRYCDDSLVQNCEVGPEVYGIGMNIEQCTNITVNGFWIHDIRGIDNASYNCFGLEIDSCTNVSCSGVSIYRPNNAGNNVAALWLDDDNAQNENINFYNCHIWSGLSYPAVALRRVVGSKFYNCLIASSNAYGISNETGGSSCVIKNTLFYNCSTSGSIYSGADNHFYGVSIPAWSTSSLTGDPGLTSPSTAATARASWDISSSASPLIDAGTTHASDSSIPELDYLFNIRSATPDVGPHEYEGTAPTAGTAVPSAPSSLVGVAIGNAASLTWSASTNSPTAYNVYIATTVDGSYSLVGTTATTAYYHNNLPTGAQRFYKVSASNQYGTSDYSNVAQVTIGATGKYEENDANVSYGGVGGSATTATYEEDNAAMTYVGADSGALTAAVTGITPVDITPTGTTGWYTVDASAYIGAAATGVIVKCKVDAGTAVHDIGIRNTSSTAGPWDCETNRHYTLFCGCTSRQFQVYREATDTSYYLTGYFNGPNVIFFDNPIDITPAATGDVWTDVDITAHTTNGTAKVALFSIDNTYAYDHVGVRCNGSTDARVHDVFRFGGHGAIGCDVDEIIEVARETTTVAVSLIGYINTNDTTVTFPVNGTDVSLTAAAAWTDMTALTANATFGFFEIVHTGANYADIRKNGYTGAAAFGTAVCAHRKTFQAVECDGSQLVEGIIQATSVDMFLNGWVVPETSVSTGAWYTVTGSYSSGSARNTGTANDYVDIAFTGSAFTLYSMKGPTFGYMQVLIDGTPITDGTVALTGDTGEDKSGIDCYNATWLYQQNVYTKSGLSDAAHTATLKCTNQKHASATEYLIQCDKFEYQSSAGGTANSWYVVTHANYSAGSAKNTLTTGDYASIAFTGTQFTVVGMTGPNFGYMQVAIDDVNIIDGEVQLPGDTGANKSGIDCYSSSWLYQQVLYSASGLSAGAHTVKLTCNGAHNPSATEDYVQLDFFSYFTSGATGGSTAITARPTNLTISANTACQPVLDWDAPAATGIAGYYVYKSASATTGYTELTFISGSATTTYTDTASNVDDVPIYYKVCAYSTEGVVGLPALNATTNVTALSVLEDNMIISNSSYTASNLGITDYIGVGSSTTGTDIKRSLLKWEYPALGTGTSVVTAYLHAYSLARVAATPLIVKAHRMSEYWFEGTKNWGASTQGDSNWVYAVYTTEPWLTAGVYNATASASDCATTGGNTTTIADSLPNQWYNIDLTAIQQEFYDGVYVNYGILLKDVNETAVNYTTFASVQNANASVRPQIQMEYQLPYVDITLLSPPSNLFATVPTGTSQVNLTWDASTGAVGGYYVERATASTGTFSQIGDTSVTAYNDTSVTAGSTYYYRVRAYNGTVTSLYTDIVGATLAYDDFTDAFTRDDQTGWGNNWVFVGDGVTGAIQLNEAHLERQTTGDTRAFVYQSNPAYKYEDVEITFKWKNYGTTANRDIRAVARYNGATAISAVSCFAGGYQKETADGSTGGSLYLQWYDQATLGTIASTSISANLDDLNYWYYGKFKCQQTDSTSTFLGIVLWREDELEPTAYTGASALTASVTTATTTSLQSVGGYGGVASYFRSQHIHFDDIFFDNLINKYYVSMVATATSVATLSGPTGAKTYAQTLTAIATAVPSIIFGNSPSPPTSVTAVGTEGAYYIDISWVAPTASNPYDLFNIYRKASTASSFGKIGSCASGIFTFRDQSPMETDYAYDYIVRSATGTLESVNSSTVSVTTNPDAPNTLSIVATSNHNYLAWDASDDNITGYQIHRSTNGIDWALLATTATTAYYDTSILTGRTYYYKVRTEDTGGAG